MTLGDMVSAGLTVGIVGAIAQFEGRPVVPWTAGGLAATAAAIACGTSWFTTPLVVVVPAYALLWWLRSRDERENRNRPGGGVVR